MVELARIIFYSPDAGNGTRDTARKSRKKASPRRLHTVHTMRTFYSRERPRFEVVTAAKKNPCNRVAGGVKVMRVDLSALLARHFPRQFARQNAEGAISIALLLIQLPNHHLAKLQ